MKSHCRQQVGKQMNLKKIHFPNREARCPIEPWPFGLRFLDRFIPQLLHRRWLYRQGFGKLLPHGHVLLEASRPSLTIGVELAVLLRELSLILGLPILLRLQDNGVIVLEIEFLKGDWLDLVKNFLQILGPVFHWDFDLNLGTGSLT